MVVRRKGNQTTSFAYDLKTMTLPHFVLIKVTIHSKYVTDTHFYLGNNVASKHIKAKYLIFMGKLPELEWWQGSYYTSLNL